MGRRGVIESLGLLTIVAVIGWWMTVPRVAELIVTRAVPELLIASGIALIWSALVTYCHESSHAAVFHARGGRRPFLAMTWLGIMLLPNTHMPGFSLLDRENRVRTVAAGPFISATLGLIPLSMFWALPEGYWQTAAALCIAWDALMVALSLSPFPNTDGTRVLEALGGVDQVQAVAFYSLMKKYPVPSGLSLGTRLLIRAYPIVLVLTSVAWVVATAQLIRSALT